jgi:alcohol dehydrogenase class IV
METKQKVYKAVSELFSVEESQLQDSYGPGDLEAWDSLGQIQLITKIEQLFDLQFSVDDVMSINNISDIVMILTKKQGGAAPSPTSSLHQETKQDVQQEAKVETPRPVSPSAGHALRAPGTVFFGEGSLAQLAMLPANRITVIIGAGDHVKELRTQINSILSKKEVFILQKPAGEPTLQGIQALAMLMQSSAPETIVAIGGGSVMDIAKLAWVLYENPDINLMEYRSPFSLPKLGKKATFVACPTTFGSGSEASSAAVFSNDKTASKTVLLSHDFLPDMAILDPKLAGSLDKSTTLSCAADALTHAIESYVSVIHNPMADQYALSALRLIFGVFESSDDISAQKLDQLSQASYFAGIAQNHCSVGLTHSIAHQLGVYGVSHGLANAVFLVPVMKFNEAHTQRYATLAKELGMASSEALIHAVQALVARFNLKIQENTAQQIKNNLDVISKNARLDITFKTNPIKPSESEIQTLIQQAL